VECRHNSRPFGSERKPQLFSVCFFRYFVLNLAKDKFRKYGPCFAYFFRHSAHWEHGWARCALGAEWEMGGLELAKVGPTLTFSIAYHSDDLCLIVRL